MGSLFSYSIFSAVILSIGYLVYKALLAGYRQHACNRLALYSIYISALLIPLVNFLFPSGIFHSSLTQITVGPVVNKLLTSDQAHTKYIGDYIITGICLIYISGVVIMLIRWIMILISLWGKISQGEKRKIGKWILVISDRNGQAPFSWLHYVVLTQADLKENSELILRHEFRHLELYHWIDLIFAQLSIILQWYNPLA